MSGQYSQNNCITLQNGNLKIQCASAVISIIYKVSMVTLKGTTTFRGTLLIKILGPVEGLQEFAFCTVVSWEGSGWSFGVRGEEVRARDRVF